jgi:hypothetical protein
MDDLNRWLTSILRPGRFECYGDTANGHVWFEYIAQHSWPHSCYDTRELALKGNEQARLHMSNYCAALAAAHLK